MPIFVIFVGVRSLNFCIWYHCWIEGVSVPLCECVHIHVYICLGFGFKLGVYG